jgi:hypothetical protein
MGNSGLGQFKPTHVPHEILIEVECPGTRRIPAGPTATGFLSPTCGPASMPSLSSTCKRDQRPKLPPSSPLFLHCRGNLPLSTCHRLATASPHHFPIPSAWLISITLRIFCPMSHHQSTTTLPSLTHLGATIHHPPVRAHLHATRR